jgi:hypothetical protein
MTCELIVALKFWPFTSSSRLLLSICLSYYIIMTRKVALQVEVKKLGPFFSTANTFTHSMIRKVVFKYVLGSYDWRQWQRAIVTHCNFMYSTPHHDGLYCSIFIVLILWDIQQTFICLTPWLYCIIFVVSILWDINKILFIRHTIMMGYIASHLLDWFCEWYNIISYFPRFPDVSNSDCSYANASSNDLLTLFLKGTLTMMVL